MPLVIFEGDVGTGKTVLAETIGRQVAETYGYGVHLLRMSTRVRGTGCVGEMGTLLSESFRLVLSRWEEKSEPIVFVIDEADSLLTSRESAEQHHEDKSGVNTVLQHLDLLRDRGAQVVVIAITNRVNALDPAVRRRATSVHSFGRPGVAEREVLFERLFEEAGFDDKAIRQLVSASDDRPAAEGGPDVPFTYSDLTLRFATPALRDAIRAEQALSLGALIERLRKLSPTPPISSD